MDVCEELLEKWKLCCERRYRIMLVVTSPLDGNFTPEALQVFADISKARVIDFKKNYKNRWEDFLTWQTVREEIYVNAKTQPVIVTEMEPFYAKWPVDERFAFLKSFLRGEPKNTIAMFISCKEDLSPLKDIQENSRGLIWAAPK